MRSIPASPTLVRRHQQWALISLVACLCLVIADRWLILQQFGFRYTDDDQTIMWYGAQEMAQGRFHEPFFFGQRYSIMLEALVAVPLLWLGVGPGQALPLTTSVLALFPFLLLAGVMVWKRRYAVAALLLALPITLPPEFGMVTSMSRGFVSGIFLASLAMLPLFSARSALVLPSSFCGVLALLANPNAVLVLAPACLLLVMQHWSSPRFHVMWIAGALPAAMIFYLGQRFHELHPHYQVHNTWALDFSVDQISVFAMHTYMAYVTPLFWGKGLFVLVLLGMLIAGLAMARQWKAAIALLVGAMLLVASFGIVKVHDGIPSVFYSWSRMFLGVPLLFALFLARSSIRSIGPFVSLIPIVAGCFFTLKCFSLSSAIELQVAADMEKNLFVIEVVALERHCDRIHKVARTHRADLVVIGWDPTKHVTNYGCACLRPGFPNTMEPELDRRTWKLHELGPMVVPNVLFAGFTNASFPKKLLGAPEFQSVSQEPLLFLLQGNAMSTSSLMDSLGFDMRPH